MRPRADSASVCAQVGRAKTGIAPVRASKTESERATERERVLQNFLPPSQTCVNIHTCGWPGGGGGGGMASVHYDATPADAHV